MLSNQEMMEIRKNNIKIKFDKIDKNGDHLFLCCHLCTDPQECHHFFFHRDEDLPAIIKKNGDKHYYQYGFQHRDSGPALEQDSDTKKTWYQYGLIHREDAPAYQDVYKSLWFYKGKKAEVNSLKEFKKFIALSYFNF